MTATRLPLREDVALDVEAVAGLPALGWSTAGGGRVRATILQRKPKRLVIRYDLDGQDGAVAVVGKWYSTDRGALVYEALRGLRAGGFVPPGCAVPRPIGYDAGLRALFVEAVDGDTVRESLAAGVDGARRAGEWLAHFHGSRFDSPRDCGPAKQLDSVRRWCRTAPRIAEVAAPLIELLEGRAAEKAPRRPVHYDYYHAQVILGPDSTVVVDMDESGLGDPALDVAHFVAHLQRLGIRRGVGAGAYADAEAAFLEGYSSVASAPETAPEHEAFVWVKLGAQAYVRGQDELGRAAVASAATALAASNPSRRRPLSSSRRGARS